MLFGKLFHAAIRTADLDATVRFYTEVLGMVVAERPPIDFLGVWLKPAQVDSDATIHIYAGEAAQDNDGNVPQGSGAVDHVSIVCQGYAEFKSRFDQYGLPYRENIVPATPLWQLFVYDPSGIQLELTFHSGAELDSPPTIPTERQYTARELWFDAKQYQQFSASQST